MKSRNNSQSGNVLWFILLGVALMALLTVVISRTSSTVEQAGSIEQASIKASSLLRFSQSVASAAQSMILNNTSESDLDFVSIGPQQDNPHCTEDRCNVFQPESGGLVYRTPDDVLGLSSLKEPWIVSASNRAFQNGCDDQTTECSDLILFLKNIPDPICLQINRLSGASNPNGKPPQETSVDFMPFTGTYEEATTPTIGSISSESTAKTDHRMSGCFFLTSDKQNVFYQVLVAR